jgi:hypothetical protein
MIVYALYVVKSLHRGSHVRSGSSVWAAKTEPTKSAPKSVLWGWEFTPVRIVILIVIKNVMDKIKCNEHLPVTKKYP